MGTLSEEEQEEISAKVDLLEDNGPNLPRPHSDVVVTSKNANMKELRGRAGNSILRVLYAFDPTRTAILLMGGDKAGNPKWYRQFVPIADRLFDGHLKQLQREYRHHGKKL